MGILWSFYYKVVSGKVVWLVSVARVVVVVVW